MRLNDLIKLLAWAGLYAALATTWVAVARWVVEPMLTARPLGPVALGIQKYLYVPPVQFLTQDPVGQWRELASAVVIALAMHAAIVIRPGRAASRGLEVILGVGAAAFLGVAVLAGYRQDYFFYEEIWYHVLRGEDPWFLVFGMLGQYPLNAYGPLFNLFAGAAWINPRAPRLLGAFAYLMFAAATCRAFAARKPGRAIAWLAPLVLLANPYPWIEAAFYGHFDVMVALTTLAAVRARERGREAISGLWLAAGVLLKYLPLALLPILADDREGKPFRFRGRLLMTAIVVIAGGMAISVLVWGGSTFRPMGLAASRPAMGASLAWAIRGPYSPLRGTEIAANIETLSTLAQLGAIAAAWWWSRTRRPAIEAVVFSAVMGLVVFYRVGYPQYQMSPFVLGWAWLLDGWDRLRFRAVPALAVGLYTAWIGAVDSLYLLDDVWRLEVGWYWVEQMAGFLVLLLGVGVVASVVAAEPAGRREDGSGQVREGPIEEARP